jgi:flagella basal body P-ring formation protein FlgA
MRLPLLLAAIIPALACQVIDADRIFGKDVAAASPVFAMLDANLEIGAAPFPGVQRVLRPEALVRLAKQNGIVLSEPAGAICFERATQPLTVEQILPALRQALGLADATIELLDFSRFGVPHGTLEFSKSSLMPNGLWRGRLVYDQNRSMPVWVKARITVERTWVEASETLAAGKSIEQSQLIMKTGPRSALDTAFVASLELVSGRRPVRTLVAGTPIAPPMLMIAHDIERGDRVAVEVKVGSAILDFQATAESSGRAGDSIMIKNPENGRSFQAKIQDKGHVLVETK